jgi:hypothetical protein
MNVRRFLGLSLFTYLMCAALAVGGVDSNEQPTTTVRSTIALQDLTPQQQAERVEALTEPSTTVSQPSTTVAPVPYETNCQEWFPTAISVGWPNDTETLKKLGRLLWKETRCLNITPLSSDPELVKWFNGHDWGIAQVNEPVHRAYVEQVFNMPFEESMSDPTLNLRFAYLLYSELEAKGKCGWRPWKLC